MMNPTWRLSEYTPDNLGLAFTDEGLLLGRTPLIERRGGRFVVREPSDIARLVKYSFPGGVAVDRLMPGLARIASALNANDQAAARIAAVHLHIPDLPGSAAHNAMVAEDALIKYARDQGGDSDWNPALHPRAGVPPNPGWFASTDGSQHEPKQDESSAGQSRLRFAENEDRSRRADAAPAVGDYETLQPGKWENGRAGEPLRLTSESQPRPRRSSASRPLRRPSQHWFGLHAPEATIIANAARGAASEVRVLKELGLVKNSRWVTTAEGRSMPDALTDAASIEIKKQFM
jgi:hypothetical protein